MFSVEQSFAPAAKAFDTIFRQSLSVDTLEHVSRQMGERAGQFLDALTTPSAEEEGEAKGVIIGLRRMATQRKLQGDALKEVQTVCGYFESYLHRMKYDEYLAAGYPIATGVIEGACRHLVKDRMKRSGMRWTVEGAQAMLNLRALYQSSYWDSFQNSHYAAQRPEAPLIA